MPEAEMDIPRMASKYLVPTPTTGKKQLEMDIKQYVKLGSGGTRRMASSVRLSFVITISPRNKSHMPLQLLEWSPERDIWGDPSNTQRFTLEICFFTGVINSFYE